jgi:hypothetical protein
VVMAADNGSGGPEFESRPLLKNSPWSKKFSLGRFQWHITTFIRPAMKREEGVTPLCKPSGSLGVAIKEIERTRVRVGPCRFSVQCAQGQLKVCRSYLATHKTISQSEGEMLGCSWPKRRGESTAELRRRNVEMCPNS